MRTNILSDKIMIFEVNSSSVKNLTIMKSSIHPDWLSVYKTFQHILIQQLSMSEHQLITSQKNVVPSVQYVFVSPHHQKTYLKLQPVLNKQILRSRFLFLVDCIWFMYSHITN